ncbi:hypothetical protein Pmani_037160 [Petrolisthes manimaculis]|uniref:Arrestin C-terminal-like domain-containing protein n=1 Tax=Petrolisthes manimaculis TaxID=1843537 RepID=A0AAE1NHT7_9EUCA|nr:hypothetical protein Pmani_037160 [Petrolisthes manimaculis]
MTLKVEVDEGQGWYGCGQVVTGRVTAFAPTTTACKAILVTIGGYTKTQWTDSEDKQKSAEETNFKEAVTIWSGRDFGDNIPQGEHTFPFQFLLPHNLPSSFEGVCGHVRYEAEARGELEWTDEPPTAKDTFKVINFIDLTQEPAMADKLDLFIQDTICCCCCEDGPIILRLTAEKTGYIPGEYILISGEVTNGTETPIDNAVITLTQTIAYHAEWEKKKKTTQLSEKKRLGIGAKETEMWNNVALYVPKTTACLRYSNIIEVKHVLKIQFNLGFASDVHIEKEISLGLIPVGKVTTTIDGEPTPPLHPDSDHPYPHPYPPNAAAVPPVSAYPNAVPPYLHPPYPHTNTDGAPFAAPPSAITQQPTSSSGLPFPPPSAPYATPSPSSSTPYAPPSSSTPYAPPSCSAPSEKPYPYTPPAPNAPPASPYAPPAPNAPPASPYGPPALTQPTAPSYQYIPPTQDLPPPPSYSSVIEQDQKALQHSQNT